MSDQKVTLRNKETGKLVEVAPENLDAARLTGRFATVSPEQRKEYVKALEREDMQQNAFMSNTITSAAEGAARSVLDLGMAGPRILGADLPTGGEVLANINEALGNDEGYEERQRQRMKAFDVAGAVGSVAPDLAALVLSGGTSGVVSAGAKAGAKGVAKRLARTAAIEGAYGGLAGGQVAAENAFREDRAVDRDELLENAGVGAVLGGTIGAAGDLLAQGVSKAAGAARSKGAQNLVQAGSLDPLSAEKIGREVAGDLVQNALQPRYQLRFGKEPMNLARLVQSKAVGGLGLKIRRGVGAATGGGAADGINAAARQARDVAFKQADELAEASGKLRKEMAGEAKESASLLKAADKEISKAETVAERAKKKYDTELQKVDARTAKTLDSLEQNEAKALTSVSKKRGEAGRKWVSLQRSKKLKQADFKLQAEKAEASLQKASVKKANLEEELEKLIASKRSETNAAELGIKESLNKSEQRSLNAAKKKAKESSEELSDDAKEALKAKGKKIAAEKAKVANAKLKQERAFEKKVASLNRRIEEAEEGIGFAKKDRDILQAKQKAYFDDIKSKERALKKDREAFSAGDTRKKFETARNKAKSQADSSKGALQEQLDARTIAANQSITNNQAAKLELEAVQSHAQKKLSQADQLKLQADSVREKAKAQYAARFDDPEAAAKLRGAYLASPTVKGINAAESLVNTYLKSGLRPQMHALANMDSAAQAATSNIPFEPLETGTGEGLLFEGFMQSGESPRGTYIKNSEMLAELAANPEKMIALIAEKTEGVMEVDPSMGQMMQQSMMRSVQFMNRYGLQDNANPLTGNPNPITTSLDIMTYRKAWDASMDPRVIVNAVGTGTLTEEQLEAARFVYPEITEQLATKAQMAIMGNKKATLQQRLQVGLLTSTPDTSLLPGFQNVYNGAISSAMPQGPPQGTGKPGRNAGSPTLAQSTKTLSQSVEQ